MSGIRISPKHGLNPSIAVCFYCGEDKNEIVLPGRMKGDREAPRRGVWNHDPCTKCAAFMTQGVICIGVDESKTTDHKNPYRDGNWCVMTPEAIARVVKPPTLVDEILRQRCTFIDSETWTAIGLPKAGKHGASKDHGHTRPE